MTWNFFDEEDNNTLILDILGVRVDYNAGFFEIYSFRELEGAVHVKPCRSPVF